MTDLLDVILYYLTRIDLLIFNPTHLMPMPERDFQNLVLMFLNDINATNKEILKFQSRKLALLEVIKDSLYSKNIDPVNAIVDQLFDAYQKMSETNIGAAKDLYEKELIMPRFTNQ